MPKVVNFYLDDSGTRHPDHNPGKRPAHGYDWFALGGVLVNQEQESEARRLHVEFLGKWKLACPLHSSEIRGKTGGFHWLEDRPKAEQARFYEELYQLMRQAPLVGLPCVIDRPGYNHRYKERYANERWSLCKTAFNIAVERAAKYARDIGSRLRVSPERCNKPEDAILCPSSFVRTSPLWFGGAVPIYFAVYSWVTPGAGHYTCNSPGRSCVNRASRLREREFSCTMPPQLDTNVHAG